MIITKKVDFFILLVLCFFSFSRITLADSGAHLIGMVGTRPMGMGGAYVAFADDTYSNLYNPAGLANGSGGEIIYSAGLNRRREAVPRFTDYFGAVHAFEVKGGSMGIGGALVQGRSKLVVEDETGRDKERQIIIGMGYTMPLTVLPGESVSIGVNLKSIKAEYTRLKNASDEATDYGLDAGVILDLGAGFTMGAAALNLKEPSFDLLPRYRTGGSPFDEPFSIEHIFDLRGGLAWQSPHGLFAGNDRISIAVDAVDLLDNSDGAVNEDIRFGVEWTTGLWAAEPGEGLVLRAGGFHWDNSDFNALTGGIGFKSNMGWKVDYAAFMGDATDDYTMHMLSFGFFF